MARFRTVSLALALAGLSLAAASRSASAQSLATGDPANTFTLEANYVQNLGQLTDFRFLPDGRIVLISKGGEVRVRTVAGATVAAGTFSVDSSSEKGLLGVEVHPQFATNKTLFFYYSASSTVGGTNDDRHRVVSITLKDDNTLDKATETILVRGLRGPANHDGGALAIGAKDQKLYIGVGDTGCNSGVETTATYTPTNYFGTCLTNGNGKILRVDLDGGIPTDNPLASVAAATACGSTCGTPISGTGTAAPRRDLWAWGFRNPFRIWSDPVTGNLWVGDVGEVTWEEVTIAQKGRHHGWPWREGKHGYPVAKCNDVTPAGDCVEPVHECKHDTDCQSLSGGLIVDSCDWPDTFRGLYFYGDTETGAVWTIKPTADRNGIVAGSQKRFGDIPNPVSFRSGPDGALYVASLGGRLMRVSVKTPVTCATPDAGPSDGGTPADAATANDTGGIVTDAAVNPGDDASTVDDGGTAAGTTEDSGCGCEVAGRSTSMPATKYGSLFVAALVTIPLLRRRKSSRARRIASV